ncbi:MAG: RloB family protein [Armatimonadota bacterium]
MTVDIQDSSSSGSDPKSILKNAASKIGDYDIVWCIFDHDGRDYINEVLKEANRLKLKIAFSNPFFELWFYLHFKYSTGQCNQDQICSKLEEFLPNYDKPQDVFSELQSKRETAIENAKKLREYHAKLGHLKTENPSTNVDELVEYLYNLNDF